ncbi:MAG: hypothetical protein WBD40_04915 [Tepidisphaeraceae bacterium]
MRESLTKAETQTATALRVGTNRMQEPTFTVRLELDCGWCEREVTVIDPHISIPELMRRIADGDTLLTEVDRPEGQIIYNERGRHNVVARWETTESEWLGDLPDVIFAVLGSESVTRADLENAIVHVEYGDEDNEDGQDLD